MDAIPLSVLGDILSGSQPYFGVNAGVSKQGVNRLGRVGDKYEVSDTRPIQGMYAGLTKGDWGVEAGGGPLASRTSHNVSPTYDIVQDIGADYVYLAALRHARLLDKLSAYGLLGAARVMFKNHEYGSNENGPNQSHKNSGADTVPVFGIGAKYQLDKDTALRIDAKRLNKVIKSHWTNDSDVKTVGIGIEKKF